MKGDKRRRPSLETSSDSDDVDKNVDKLANNVDKKKKSSPEAKKKIVRHRNLSDNDVIGRKNVDICSGGNFVTTGDSSSSPSLLNLPHWRHQTSPMSGPSPVMTELANLVRSTHSRKGT